MSKAIVLLAHGARDPAWARPIEAMAARLRLLLPGTPVASAYLEFMAPDIETAIENLAAQGRLQITVVPVFLAQGGHVKRDLPAKLAALREKLGAAHDTLAIELLAAIGEQPEVIDAIAVSVARLVGKHGTLA